MTAQAAAEASALRSENHLTKATLSSASRDSGILSSTLAHLPATDSVQNFPKWGLSFGLSHYAGFFQVTGVVEGSFASSICGVVREAGAIMFLRCVLALFYSERLNVSSQAKDGQTTKVQVGDILFSTQV